MNQTETTIDEALRQRHLAALATPEGREMYERTIAQCFLRPGGVTATDQDMIYDLCSAEDMKQALAADIKKRGAVVETRNGRQVFHKENPSMARMCRYTELQRKIRADLKITPAKRAQDTEMEEEPESADAFESF